ncbi:MAG: hypothetical protein QM661_07825 [Solimonas sp.]
MAFLLAEHPVAADLVGFLEDDEAVAEAELDALPGRRDAERAGADDGERRRRSQGPAPCGP